MTLTLTLTLTQLLNDEQALRQVSAEVLTPKEQWTHNRGVVDAESYECGEFICVKCLSPRPKWSQYCSIPDSVTDPLEVVARRLLEKVKSSGHVICWHNAAWKMCSEAGFRLQSCEWYIFEATPAEQCVCCLAALGKVQL